jgi:hypothetical protein
LIYKCVEVCAVKGPFWWGKWGKNHVYDEQRWKLLPREEGEINKLLIASRVGSVAKNEPKHATLEPKKRMIQSIIDVSIPSLTSSE